LKELKSKVGDNEALKNRIEELENANKDAKSTYENTVAEMKRNYAVDSSIRDAKAKNVKAVKALLDMTKVKMDGETVIGLKDQLDAIAKSDAYLFETVEPPTPNFAGGFEPGKGSNGGGNVTPTSFADAIQSSLAKAGIKN
jgi:hypothetical protein